MTLSQLKADQKNGIDESKSRTRKCKEESLIIKDVTLKAWRFFVLSTTTD